MRRAKAVELVSKCSNRSIRMAARVALAELSISQKTKNIDVTVEEGCAQGCPLSPLLFAEAFNLVLNKVKDLVTTSAHLLAYLDDTYFLGDIEKSLRGLRAMATFLEEDFGMELNAKKCFVISKHCDHTRAILTRLTEEDAWFRHIKIGCSPGCDPSTVKWGEGVGIQANGNPRGDDHYVHRELNAACNEAIQTLWNSALKMLPHSKHHTQQILLYSGQNLFIHRAMVTRPNIMEPYMARFQKALREILSQCWGFDVSSYCNNALTLVGIRIELRSSKGGCGFRDLRWLCNQAFINGCVLALPRLCTRRIWNHADGRYVTKMGCCPPLHGLLDHRKIAPDKGAFSTSRDGKVIPHRFYQFVSETSQNRSKISNAFYAAIRDVQRQAVVWDDNAMDNNAAAPSTGILSTPAESFGADDHNQPWHKIQKEITRQLEEGKIIQANMLADNMNRAHPQREAWKTFHSQRITGVSTAVSVATSSPESPIGNADLATFTQLKLGLPLTILEPHQFKLIPSTRGTARRIGKHGTALASAPLTNNINTDRHDTILHGPLQAMLSFTKIQYKIEDKDSFAEYNTTRQNPREYCRPDITLKGYKGNTITYADLKIMAPGTKMFTTNTIEGTTLAARQRLVDADYKRKVAKADEILGNNHMSQQLDQAGRVLGIVIDCRGNISDDLADLIKVCADSAAEKHWERMGMRCKNHAKSTFQRLFTSMIGLTTARASGTWYRRSLDWALTYRKDRQSSTSSAALRRTRERLRRQRQAYNDAFFFGRRIRSGPHRAR